MEGCKDKGNIENSTLCGWDAGGCISGTKKFPYFSEHWFGPNKAWKCSLRDLHDETAWKILNRKTSVTGVVSFEYTGSDGPTCRLSWYLSRDINLFHIRYKWHCQLLIWENLAFVLSDRVVSQLIRPIAHPGGHVPQPWCCSEWRRSVLPTWSLHAGMQKEHLVI